MASFIRSGIAVNSRKPWRRWLRFSLRGMMVWLLVAGVGFSAFHTRLHRANQRAEAVERLQEFGGFVRYDNFRSSSNSASAESGPFEDWLVTQLGLDFFHDVESVCISGRKKFSDDDFALACRLGRIRSLRLGPTLLTDKGLEPIAQLEELRAFSISSPHISDRGMVAFAGLTQLESLMLHDVRLTDAGLSKLATLTNLERLYLGNTQVTEQGVVNLRQVLPNCEINFDD